MLKRVAVEGIEFPRLYIAEDANDVSIAKANGIPFVKWTQGHDALVRQLLRPTLEKLFPGISWSKVLGRKVPVRSKVVIVGGVDDKSGTEAADYDKDAMLKAQHEHDKVADTIERGQLVEQEDNGTFVRDVDIAEDWRDCPGGGGIPYDMTFEEEMLRIEDYVGDLSSSVDIEALQKLGMLPKFLGDITDNIRHNFSQSMRWTEGYTKKLGVPLGRFNAKAELPNLVIIDVSHSIPDGIAATMLTLADTLRSQCNAELIITSCRSGYYEAGAELPSPQALRDYYGRGNEAAEFFAILDKHIAGREFGHVISFGDNDNPGWRQLDEDSVPVGLSLAGTKVHAVHHYHTCMDNRETGYARWVKECCPTVSEEFDTSWCDVMNKKYRM